MVVGCSAAPVGLSDWFAAFGLGETETLKDVEDTSDETSFEDSPVKQLSKDIACDPTKCRMLHGVCIDCCKCNKHCECHHEVVKEHKQQQENAFTDVVCDPTQCRMQHGICCDCCKCFDHCECNHELKFLPSTCDTPECSERVCAKCLRCHNHCMCQRTARTEHDGTFMARVSPSASVTSSKRSSTRSNSERVAPPLLHDDSSFRRDHSSLVSYTDEADNWMGHNTRVEPSDGTIATLTTTKTDKTMRVSKTNFEVVYDQNYTSEQPPQQTTNRRKSGGRRPLKRRISRGLLGFGPQQHHLHLLSMIMTLLLCVLPAAAGVTAAQKLRGGNLAETQQTVRDLLALALYTLPKVEMEMTTEWTDDLLQAKAIAEQNGENGAMILLSQTGRQDSTLSYPLRASTQEYLYQGFLQQIEQLAAETFQHNEAPQEDGVETGVETGVADSSGKHTFYNMYNEVHTVDLQVRLFLDVAKTTTQPNIMVALHAEMLPTVAFVEPSDKQKPSNSEVYQLFGTQWMYEDLLQRQLANYQQKLNDPTYPLWLQKSAIQQVELMALTTSSPSSSKSSGWSGALQNFMISLLILLGVGAVVVGLLAVQHRRRQKHYERQLSELYLDNGEDEQYQDEYSQSYSDHPHQNRSLQLTSSHDDASFISASTASTKRPPPISTRASSLDALRHGQDVFHRSPQMNAMSALEASDRYLSKHRPDLYNEAQNGDFSIFGRSYQIPSNPFEWLYGGSGGTTEGHYPFGKSSAFTPSNDPVSRSSFSTPSPSGATTPTSAFTPIQPNLAARYMDTESSGHGHLEGSAERRSSATKHTGQNWQYEEDENRSSASSVVGSIFRNLSMNSWVSGSQQQQQGHYPTAEDFAHQDPALGDIELEELQDEDYDFAFKDFPRVDGTPCLIYKDNEDELKERERKRIFVIEDQDDGLPTEKESKQDDADAAPVSDRAFLRMLSENSLAIDEDDDEVNGNADDDDDDLVLPGMQDEEASAKSPKFQQQLARLMETKQRRYAMEYKKEVIVKDQRQKRKHLREQQRVERHKAMERDLEEIEAEFLSPLARDLQEKQQLQQQQSSLQPPRSPKPPSRSGNWNAHSPMRGKAPAASPVPKYGASARPTGHQRVNSMGASPFRRMAHSRSGSFSNAIGQGHNMGAPSPRVSRTFHQRGGSMGHPISRSASHDVGDSNGDSLSSSQHGSVRPVNMYKQDMFGQSKGHDILQPELSIPVISGNPKYPSPQAVIDEALQQSPPGKSAGRQPHTFNHRRTRTPTKPSGGIHPTGSFDVVDFGHNAFSNPQGRSPLKRSNSHRRSQSSTMGGQGNSRHQRSNSQHSLGGRHRRSNSQSSNRSHRRSNSQSAEDIFLHGVVAQTRFV